MRWHSIFETFETKKAAAAALHQHLQPGRACVLADSGASGGAGTYWENVKAPLRDLLDRNNITSAANITLQLIGGGSRIPRVQAELSSVLEGLSLEKQLDADEAPALGAALMAANISTTFRLRQFGMQDGLMFPVSISLEPGEGIPDIHSVRRCSFAACMCFVAHLWTQARS